VLFFPGLVLLTFLLSLAARRSEFRRLVRKPIAPGGV